MIWLMGRRLVDCASGRATENDVFCIRKNPFSFILACRLRGKCRNNGGSGERRACFLFEMLIKA